MFPLYSTTHCTQTTKQLMKNQQLCVKLWTNIDWHCDVDYIKKISNPHLARKNKYKPSCEYIKDQHNLFIYTGQMFIDRYTPVYQICRNHDKYECCPNIHHHCTGHSYIIMEYVDLDRFIKSGLLCINKLLSCIDKCLVMLLIMTKNYIFISLMCT